MLTIVGVHRCLYDEDESLVENELSVALEVLVSLLMTETAMKVMEMMKMKQMIVLIPSKYVH